MITAILTMAMIWCLFYGRVATPLLGIFCVGLGASLVLLGRHRHTQFFKIDVLAQVSRLNKVSPSLKFWTVAVLMGLCISAQSPIVGIFLCVAVLILVVCVGELKLHDYMYLLSLPVSFLILSGFALLFEVGKQHTGILGIHAFGYWFCITSDAQTHTALVMARALGAVSCLYLLSLTTPVSELIGVLRRAHCPDVFVGLMYLIYRYIFILLSMYYTMRDAASSRLGYVSYRANIRTTGSIYSNLLARSYRRASLNFDAMESRCYETEICFLENTEKITILHATVAACMIILTLGLCLWFC